MAEMEEGLLRQYHHELSRTGVGSYSLADCRDDYRLALVALVSQAWDGSPFRRSVLSLFIWQPCERLIR